MIFGANASTNSGFSVMPFLTPSASCVSDADANIVT